MRAIHPENYNVDLSPRGKLQRAAGGLAHLFQHAARTPDHAIHFGREPLMSEATLPGQAALDAPVAPSRSLRDRVLRGSVWTLSGHGVRQVLRLGSNLVLTRLLFPEAFGLMALVQVFLQGLEMFSDLGIQPSIIQSPRGGETRFLNTAWTLQVVRGGLLWLAACLLAWPAAWFYSEPMLLMLLPTMGLATVIAGFRSTKLATANRDLALGRMTLIELGAYAVSVVVMVALAWQFQSVWSLVGGVLAGTLVQTILSHWALPGESNGLHWDRAAFDEIWRFGRWIFLSTLLAYLASQGDRLVLGKMLDVRALGIYGIALLLSRFVVQIITQTTGKVLFPSYAELVRERPERLYVILRKSRLLMLALSWSASLILILWGEDLVRLLYDDRYKEAGWMLRTLSIGTLVYILGQSYHGVLLARGQPRMLTTILAWSVVLQIAAMFAGAHWGGREGVIVGLALVTWLIYPIEAYYHAQLSLWQPEVDLPLYGLATVLAGWWLFF